VEVDTRHFKGNYPDRCSFEGADAPAGASPAGLAWMAFGPTPKLEADRMARFEIEPPGAGPFTHVRFNIFPDGGVARLRLYGRPLPPGANP
jgi:allantoicase